MFRRIEDVGRRRKTRSPGQWTLGSGSGVGERYGGGDVGSVDAGEGVPSNSGDGLEIVLSGDMGHGVGEFSGLNLLVGVVGREPGRARL